jgi:uncharacterized glyoxalase superfamily metalloenzyme YdcJ
MRLQNDHYLPGRTRWRVTSDEIRSPFSEPCPGMYQQEVPQYGTLLELVADVNAFSALA